MASNAADQSVASTILLAVASAASNLSNRNCCSRTSSNVNASSSLAKRTSCVLEFIPKTYSAMAYGGELGEIAGTRENFYEGIGRKNTCGSTGSRRRVPQDIHANGLGTIESECRPCALDRVDRGSALSNPGALSHLLRPNIARGKLRTPLSRPTEPGCKEGPVLSIDT